MRAGKPLLDRQGTEVDRESGLKQKPTPRSQQSGPCGSTAMGEASLEISIKISSINSIISIKQNKNSLNKNMKVPCLCPLGNANLAHQMER